MLYSGVHGRANISLRFIFCTPCSRHAINTERCAQAFMAIGNILMRLLTTLTLLTICLAAIGQAFPTKKGLTFYPGTYIDTESRYIDSTGIVLIIQNSVRQAGGSLDSTGLRGYTDSNGKKFGFAIFWTRIVNETAAPIELTISFLADSIAIPPSSDSYLKLFLPPGTMTLGKEMLYNYGATGLKSFLDTAFHRPTTLQRTMKPNEAFSFYVLGIHHKAVVGINRAGFVLKEQELFYRVDMVGELDSLLIPCGRIVTNN
jgi:hypothetical protein